MTTDTKDQLKHAEDDTRYQGWTNYETWAMHLWLTNEQSDYHYWREQAETHIRNAPKAQQVEQRIWTVAEAARFGLADQLREEIEDASPIKEPSVYTDLLGAAISNIDWHEVAQAFTDEVQENETTS
jgi:hypothetical protein